MLKSFLGGDIYIAETRDTDWKASGVCEPGKRAITRTDARNNGDIEKRRD